MHGWGTKACKLFALDKLLQGCQVISALASVTTWLQETSEMEHFRLHSPTGNGPGKGF